jgi:hypothetical protein
MKLSTMIFAFMSAISMGQPVFAQPRPSLPAEDQPVIMRPEGEPTRLLRQNNITSTGKTVPHPGVPQGSGPTPLDYDIERENNRIDSSICKGC